MSFSERLAAGIDYLERPARGGGTLLLLHGVGSNAATFAPLLPLLPTELRVIAWNAPGYGRSPRLAPDWPVAADYAAALARFLDMIGLERVTLVGHSLGCLTGAAFAAEYRDRVERLVLSSPALGHGVRRGVALSPAAQARVDDLAELGPEAFADRRAARLVHAPADNVDVVARVRDAMSKVTLEGYPQAARMLASGRLLDDAERLQVRTDVIVGREDVVTPPEAAKRAHAAIRLPFRGTLTIVPDAGHALYQQAPEAFAQVLSAPLKTAA